MAGTEYPSVVVHGLSLDSEYRLSAVGMVIVESIVFLGPPSLSLHILETVFMYLCTVFLQIPTQICTGSYKQERGHRLNKHHWFTAKNKIQIGTIDTTDADVELTITTCASQWQ